MCIFDHIDSYNDKYTIIALPSGEAFEINSLQLYNLYENEIINFDYRKEFWFFDETKHINRIKFMLNL